MPEFVILTPDNYQFGLEDSPIDEALFTPNTTDGPFTVTNATNASPIRITVSVSHGLFTGRGVAIFGVEGNTAANGWWMIQEVGGQPAQFDLLGAVGNGAYTTGGTAVPGNSFQGLGSALGEAIQLHLALALNEVSGETSETILSGASVY